jgi:hypothetical protein
MRSRTEETMAKKRIMANLSEEAANRLDSMVIADNCSPDAILEHLLMGRMLVQHGQGTVPELAVDRLRAVADAAYSFAKNGGHNGRIQKLCRTLQEAGYDLGHGNPE